MAGMFYSLQEVAEKLNKTEDEIKDIVKEGRLREFRDGTNLLFKVDEVESLMSDSAIRASQPQRDEPVQQEELIPEFEPIEEDDLLVDIEPVQEEETVQGIADVELKPASSEDTFIEVGEDTSVGVELTDADTAIANEGISMLGETDTEYKLADDSSADTREASLEEIEEDVSLDSFGSGSGLLDLSLQADDTSLGGILDEIYTSEDQEEQMPDDSGGGSGMEIAPDSSQMLTSVGLGTQDFEQQPSAAGQAYIEPAPDAVSNAMGISLFLPLLAVIYAALVLFTSFGKGVPVILKNTQGITWYIMIGVIVVAFLIIGVAFMVGSGGGSGKPKKAKPKKVKKPKKEKKKKKKSKD